jgi:hypothetical protein
LLAGNAAYRHCQKKVFPHSLSPILPAKITGKRFSKMNDGIGAASISVPPRNRHSGVFTHSGSYGCKRGHNRLNSAEVTMGRPTQKFHEDSFAMKFPVWFPLTVGRRMLQGFLVALPFLADAQTLPGMFSSTTENSTLGWSGITEKLAQELVSEDDRGLLTDTARACACTRGGPCNM